MTSPISLFKRGKPLPVVAERYAQAFFDLALERGQLDMAEADARAFRAMIAGSKELQGLLSSPVARRAVMADALGKLFDDAKFSALTRQFMQVSVGNGRARDMAVILDAFLARIAAHKGDVVADVTSAHTLTDAQQEALKKALLAALSAQGVKTVNIASHVDENALGGMSVQVGALMFDGTLKSRLHDMGRVLKS